ncbi:siroheme synthase [Altererythrobacter xixiisoli]|uniref:precorrin-2 dehydrogenase n=1 Tax=Croceibacterium xixiisoli TaxID=1476466 RepID=A0A6I4TTW0_9SPHN|nr:siroheme synthase [Croceibacterium xixiisoli]MXO99635.1 siroheme synthase [Croceibacterium xixiisoli]
MQSLPLFHQIAGRPIIVLGEGPAADQRRRLVEGAGGVVIGSAARGIAAGARLGFIAHADGGMCEVDATMLGAAGILINVTDRPDLCDFTMPSLLDRDPLLIAVGTGGASAGLAKQLRLRLEALLPADLGALASGLSQARAAIRMRWSRAADRRRAIDSALEAGGMLDPFTEGAGDRIGAWLTGGEAVAPTDRQRIALTSDDPDDLTLRQARLLGRADCVLHDPAVPPAILARARADAVRIALPHASQLPAGLVVELRRES